MKKMIAVTVTLILCLMLFVGCSPEDAVQSDADETAETAGQSTQPQDTDESEELLSLTLSELEQYNGQDGMPAYVAIDGTIYDMSAIAPWAGGKHNGHIAGHDLTEDLKTRSPHGISVLKKLPIVGTVKE